MTGKLVKGIDAAPIHRNQGVRTHEPKAQGCITEVGGIKGNSRMFGGGEEAE